MVSLLLAIIYLAFISLGLPDSLLGAAWPTMHTVINVPLSAMGILTMITSMSTVISSLFIDKILRKVKIGYVVFISTLLTAFGMLMYSFSSSFILLCFICIPYGLGAGGIDASLNNYVALHYSGRSMNFLHCFWGVGTIISPYIMSYALTYKASYQAGYRYVFFIQLTLSIILLLAIPLWSKVKHAKKEEQEEVIANLSFKQKLSINGVFLVLFGFMCYCALESTAISWSATYLVESLNYSKEIAAAYSALFFIGMTLGRAISGLVTDKIGDKNMIRIGYLLAVIGLTFIILSKINPFLSLVGLVILGLGCGPIYPSIVHSTPVNFGKENSQAIIGLQMAFAYLGSTLLAPLFGVIANYISPNLFPFYMGFYLIIMILLLESLNKKVSKRNAS